MGQLQDAATKSADSKELKAVVMLDQTAAFDLVDHQILLAKMREMQFQHSTIKWFNSFLEGRGFSVRVSCRQLLSKVEK